MIRSIFAMYSYAAPILGIGSLIGIFFGLGGWGWILFLAFSFSGMYAMAAAKKKTYGSH